jgi:phosphatidylglycerol:prolipoprotein diacylglycerol transferase
MLTLFRNIFAPPRDLILIVAAAWLGLSLAERRATRHNVTPEALNNLLFASLLAFILGGRIFYAAEHLSAFAQSPLNLISINVTLFDFWGGLIAALITAFVYGQRGGLSLLPTLDAFTPFFATLAVGLGLSHLASGAVFGQETTLPWGINLWSAIRHPTQIYEIIASLGTLGLLWSRKADPKPGGDFLLFAALTSASQLFIAGFRGDTTLIFGGLRAEQIAAWVALALSLVGMEFLKRPAMIEREESPPVLATSPKQLTNRPMAQKKRAQAGKAKTAKSRKE